MNGYKFFGVAIIILGVIGSLTTLANMPSAEIASALPHGERWVEAARVASFQTAVTSVVASVATGILFFAIGEIIDHLRAGSTTPATARLEGLLRATGAPGIRRQFRTSLQTALKLAYPESKIELESRREGSTVHLLVTVHGQEVDLDTIRSIFPGLLEEARAHGFFSMEIRTPYTGRSLTAPEPVQA